MNENLNIATRSEVLEIALSIEEAINNLLSIFLEVSVDKPRAITHRSSSLSFKNKIDLLFDMGVLETECHGPFLLLMEFRNQFMHNSKCNSFVIASELLNREKQLLAYLGDKENFEKEDQFRIAYNKLHIKCLDILITQYEKRKNDLLERRMIVVSLANFASKISDLDKRIFDDILKVCSMPDSNSRDEIKLKNQILDIISNGHQRFETDKKFKDYMASIEKILADKYYIKKTFWRH